MAAPNKGTNGVTKKNGEVRLAREEYDALMSREERFVEIVADNARLTNHVNDLAGACDAQTRRLAGNDLKVQHLERISGLQAVLIDHLRAGSPNVAALADLSEFWREWQVHTRKSVDAKKVSESDVAKYEPDLFRSWAAWLRDADKVGRTILDSGSMTRIDIDNGGPRTAYEMQEHVIRRQNEEIAKLRAREDQLHQQVAELTKFKGNP